MRNELFSFVASAWFEALTPGFSTSVWRPASHGFGKNDTHYHLKRDKTEEKVQRGKRLLLV